MNLTAMTFNLRLNHTDDGENAWPYRKDNVVQTILANDPHIFGIQEGLPMMVSKLKESLPAYEMIGEGRGGGDVDEYSALFYKKEQLILNNHGQFWLSETPEVANSISWDSACPRICTWGEFALKNNPSHRFVFFNTHLDHIGQEARKKGAELICSNIGQYLDANLPVIFTGDLNVEPDNEVIDILEKADLVRLHTEGKTFHDFKGGIPGEPIDYIFTSKQVKVLNIKVDRRNFDGKYPSDHYPLVAELVI